jgi:uncharacterized membrane protein YphA (DoxX/SURF4 family)
VGSFLYRFFSTFPGRAPGAGLLILRTSAGGVTALHGALWLTQSADPGALAWVVGLLATLGGLMLAAGLLTPGAALAVGASMVSPVLQAEVMVAALVVVNAVALALIGPGAYSIDAYLFGRREIIIPSDSGRR